MYLILKPLEVTLLSFVTVTLVKPLGDDKENSVHLCSSFLASSPVVRVKHTAVE